MTLRTAHGECSGCGYDLIGLSPSGSCPECGQAYDVFSGQGIASAAASASQRGEQLVAWARTGCLGAMTLGILLAGMAMMPFVSHPLRPLAVAFCLALLPLLATLYSLLLQLEARRGKR